MEEIYKSVESYESQYTNYECNLLDPINIFRQRLNSNPDIICSWSNSNSNHIYYKDNNPIFVAQRGTYANLKMSL